MAAPDERIATAHRLNLSCGSAHRRHLGSSRAVAGAICGPIVHEPSPLVEQIAAPIGSLNLIFDCVGQRHFGNLVGMTGAFGCPIAEARTEAVHRRVNFHAAHEHSHGHVRQLATGEKMFTAKWLKAFQDRLGARRSDTRCSFEDLGKVSAPARRVLILTTAARLGAIEHGLNPPSNPSRSFGFGAPDRLENSQHMRRFDFGSRQISDDWKDVAFECVPPLLAMLCGSVIDAQTLSSIISRRGPAIGSPIA